MSPSWPSSSRASVGRRGLLMRRSGVLADLAAWALEHPHAPNAAPDDRGCRRRGGGSFRTAQGVAGGHSAALERNRCVRLAAQRVIELVARCDVELAVDLAEVVLDR